VKDEPNSILFALGASVLGSHCKSEKSIKLLIKVNLRIFDSLKTLGSFGEKNWEDLLSILKKCEDTVLGDEMFKLHIVPKCLDPLLHLL